MKSRRIGRFYISEYLIHEDEGQIAQMLAMMKFVPLSNESHLDRAAILYVGISPLFEEIPSGMFSPEYDMQVKTDLESGRVTEVKAVQLEKDS